MAHAVQTAWPSKQLQPQHSTACASLVHHCEQTRMACVLFFAKRPRLCRCIRLLSSSVQNEELELQYKTCYARILDSKRRFLVRCCGCSECCACCGCSQLGMLCLLWLLAAQNAVPSVAAPVAAPVELSGCGQCIAACTVLCRALGTTRSLLPAPPCCDRRRRLPATTSCRKWASAR